MSIDIPGIHPETLIDKLEAGSLTEAERQLLHRHLEGCAVCRFEVTVRADFADEANALEAAAFEELTTALAPPDTQPVGQRQPSTKRTSRSRRVLALAAAAVALASGAAALVGGVPTAPDGQSTTATIATKPQRSENVLAKQLQLEEPTEPTHTPAASGGLNPAKPKLGSTIRTARARSAAPRPKLAVARAEAASVDHTEEPSAPPSASELFSEANRARRASDLSRATELYRRLQREFPGSEEALLSLVTLGSLQLDTGNASAALRAFNRYLRQSGLPLEAEALYGRARALGQLGQQGDETRAWQRLLARHPRSGYAKQARERLSALGDP